MLSCHLNAAYQLRDVLKKKGGNSRNLSSRLVRFDPPVRDETREGSCVKRDAQSDSGDCVNSRASIKTRRCPRPGASEQVLSVIPVAIWDSEIQQFDKPFRTVVPKVGVQRPPGVLLWGSAGGQSRHADGG